MPPILEEPADAAAQPAPPTPPTATGLTHVVPQTAEVPPELVAKAEEFKKAGLDILQMEAQPTLEAFQKVQQLAALNVPAQIETRANELAEKRYREFLEKRQESPEATEPEPEEPVTEGNAQERLLARLESLEKRIDGDAQSRQQKDESAALHRMWSLEYQAMQQQYPILQSPKIDALARLVTTSNLATTNDPAADRAGYVTNFVGQLVSLLGDSAQEISSSMAQMAQMQGGSGELPKGFDYADSSDTEFAEALAQMLGEKA